MRKLAVFFFVLFSLASYSAQTTLTYRNTPKAINVVFNKGADSTITFVTDADSAVIINHLNSLFSGQNINSIYEAWYDDSDTSNRYLVFRSSDPRPNYS
jgi:hypothetical protein